MHMRRMEDSYMHRRMQKNKHMQGNDLDTPTVYGVSRRCFTILRRLPLVQASGGRDPILEVRGLTSHTWPHPANVKRRAQRR